MVRSSRAICTNYPGWNLVRTRYKTLNFDVVREQPATKFYPNQLNRLRRVNKLYCLKSHPCLLNLSKRNGGTIWFSTRNFRFFHVNGKFPSFPDLSPSVLGGMTGATGPGYQVLGTHPFRDNSSSWLSDCVFRSKMTLFQAVGNCY